MHKSSISRKIAIAAIALTMSIVIVTGTISYFVMHSIVRDRLVQHMTFEGTMVRNKLDSLMEHLNHETDIMSENIVFVNALIDSEGRDMYIRPFLKSYKLPENIPFTLTLCDFEGKAIISSAEKMRDYTDPDMVARLVDDETPLARIIEKGKKDHSIMIAYPVFYGATGMAEGMLVMEAPFEYLLDLAIRPSFNTAHTSESLTAGFEWNYSGHRGPARILNQAIRQDVTDIHKLDLPMDLTGPLDQLGFTFSLIENTSNTFRPLSLIFFLYFIAGLVILFVTYILSQKMSIRLVRPLTELTEHANQLSFESPETAPLEVKGDDEVASLSASFITMVERIRESHEDLDKKVRERTMELEQANKEMLLEVAERKKAEEKIKESEEYIRNILDSVDESFLVIDRSFNILSMNEAFRSFVNRPDDAIIGRHCYEITHNRTRPCYEEGESCVVKRVFETGASHTISHKHLMENGDVVYVETKAFPLTDENGNISSAIEIIHNVTEKHLLEEEQLKGQKLEAIGTLAGGIAHDFNNLLQGIFGYISMARIHIDRKERALKMLEEAEKALDVSVNLSNQLLTFSKGGKPVKKTIALAPLINDNVKFSLSGSKVNYDIRIEDALWSVDADAGQLSQVIQNIVLNANEAMPEGGTVHVTARNVTHEEDGRVPILRKGNYVEIIVRDEGIGIPEDLLPKIFDPYITTKQKGSGLGLATSYSIIKQHDGTILAESEPNRGSAFTVYLPAASQSALESLPAEQDETSTRPGAKILIMDDEEIVREIGGEMIRILGHTADFAANGEEAIEKYERAMKEARPYDIVILDLTIRGGMGGEATIKRLSELDENVKAIVSSGYSDADIVSDFRSYGFLDYLQKPYDLASLKDAINRVFNGTVAG